MRTLQKVSGFWFLVLGFLMIAAYVCVRGEVLGVWPAYMLQYGDLPFLFSALIYGATSLLLSVQGPKGTSKVLQVMIALLVLSLFAAVCVMNFWVK